MEWESFHIMVLLGYIILTFNVLIIWSLPSHRPLNFHSHLSLQNLNTLHKRKMLSWQIMTFWDSHKCTPPVFPLSFVRLSGKDYQDSLRVLNGADTKVESLYIPDTIKHSWWRSAWVPLIHNMARHYQWTTEMNNPVWGKMCPAHFI
jgi:hypothetical protein